VSLLSANHVEVFTIPICLFPFACCYLEQPITLPLHRVILTTTFTTVYDQLRPPRPMIPYDTYFTLLSFPSHRTCHRPFKLFLLLLISTSCISIVSYSQLIFIRICGSIFESMSWRSKRVIRYILAQHSDNNSTVETDYNGRPQIRSYRIRNLSIEASQMNSPHQQVPNSGNNHCRYDTRRDAVLEEIIVGQIQLTHIIFLIFSGLVREP